VRWCLPVLAILVLVSGCAPKEESSETSAAPITAYCSYIASPNTFSSSVTLTGTASYQYRLDGNGVIPDGTNAFEPDALANGESASMRVNATTITYNCATASGCPKYVVAPAMVTAINSSGTLAAASVKATGLTGVGVYKTTTGSFTVTNLTKMTALNQRPIRRAEVIVKNGDGTIVQCTETNDSGAFSAAIPDDGGTYTVQVASRANNAFNTAYVMNNPTANSFYTVSTTVTGSGSPSATLVASASGSLIGGAFNILDQILKAQEYLRTQTSGCSGTFGDCSAFTTAPLVKVYWTAGLTPGVYYGISGGISFYLNDDKELYILGGVDGNTETQDMDHFDNSVIIHEYGHFIEDQFANPNSPGGSHNGNSIIDPRLAWGEGWANFFQAAVTGVPYYRDTYGHVQCSAGTSCTGANFNEFLDPTGGSYNDKPTGGNTGEGNFREFSVSRLLWDVVKPTSGTSQFAEIWTAFNGPTNGMKVITDPFKSIGRFHVIQAAITGATNWSAIRSTEEQVGTLAEYATPLVTTGGCSPSTVSMSIYRSLSDDGSFSKSDQYRNNDFYIYDHPGGALNLGLTWSGAGIADLDLYIYKTGYVFGTASTVAAKNDTETSTTSGSAPISTSLAAGRYMINVMAYTGLYGGVTTAATTYALTINGATACPSP
jgi:hypothetical protein